MNPRRLPCMAHDVKRRLLLSKGPNVMVAKQLFGGLKPFRQHAYWWLLSSPPAVTCVVGFYLGTEQRQHGQCLLSQDLAIDGRPVRSWMACGQSKRQARLVLGGILTEKSYRACPRQWRRTVILAATWQTERGLPTWEILQ